MSKESTQPTARAVRPGRQLVVHFVFALLLIAGMSAYWFGVKGQGENRQAEGQRERTLEQASSRLNARLESIELISSIIGSSILANGSASLVNEANALPPVVLDRSGLTAISWWPQTSSTQPRYLVRETGTWLEHDINGGDLQALAQRKIWFQLAPDLAGDRCLWSEREREAVSGQMVVSCSRAIENSRGRFLGVLRYSYRTGAFDDLLARLSDAPVLLLNSNGAYLASNTPGIADARSLAEIGQKLPALSPLTTAVQQAGDENLRRHQAHPDFPQALAQKLVENESASDLNRAATTIAALTADTKSLSYSAICVEGWCAQARPAMGAPWVLISIGELPSVMSVAAVQLPKNLPLLVFSAAILGLTLLHYLLLIFGWMRPLSRLTAPLARMEPGPGFDEKLKGEWGQLARALNEMAEHNERLRAQLISPRQIAKPSEAGNSTPWDLIPIPVVVLGSDGKVSQANAPACSQLDLAPGTDAREMYLQREPDGELFSLPATPDTWVSELCRFRTGNVDGHYAVSTRVLNDPPGRLLLLAPAKDVPKAQASADTVKPLSVVSTTANVTQLSRQALNTITAPVHWLSLQVGPELVTPALTDIEAQDHFREQLEARIEDRLEPSEHLLKWGPGHFIVTADAGITEERAEELRQGLQSTLIFLASERVRLKATTALFTVRPHMSSQDFDAAIFASIRESRGELAAEDTRSYDNATLTRLVNKGFQENRFQLITENGLHPGVKDDTPLAFRVLPHLEDEEGFWMSEAEYLPVLKRLDRRSDHDTWLIDAVHAALSTLGEQPPEQILLPLCGQILGSAHNEVAEKLSALARDPGLTDSTIYVTLNADEAQSNGIDLLRTRNLIHSLGCRLALANIGMDTQSMAQLERVRPDMMIAREALVHAALDSPIIGIGLESLIRAGDKLKCSTVLPGINNERGRQLVEKLRPSLAFGLAIGKPSPLPFRAVA